MFHHRYVWNRFGKVSCVLTNLMPRKVPELWVIGCEIQMLPWVGVPSGVSKPNIVTYDAFGMIIWSGLQIKFSELCWCIELTCVGKQIRNGLFLAQCKPICRWTQESMLQKNDGLPSGRWTAGATGDSENLQNVAIGCINEVFFDWVALGGNDSFLEARSRLQSFKETKVRSLTVFWAASVKPKSSLIAVECAIRDNATRINTFTDITPVQLKL